MDHIWAPWRGVYFDQLKGGECISCGMNENGDDSKSHVIYRCEAVFGV